MQKHWFRGLIQGESSTINKKKEVCELLKSLKKVNLAFLTPPSILNR
jgi:hypothetical protein